MAYSVRHRGTVQGGRIRFDDFERWRTDVDRKEGKRVRVTIEREERLHSDNQRKYYRGVVVEMIAEYIGESRDDTHELLKRGHLEARDIELLNGKHIDMPPTTRFLSTEEYSAYIERCRHWAAEFLSLYIPDPNEVEVTR